MRATQEAPVGATAARTNLTMLPTAAAAPPPNPTSRRGRFPRGVVGIWRGQLIQIQRELRAEKAAASELALRSALRDAVDRRDAAIRRVTELSASLSSRPSNARAHGDFA